VFAGAAREAVFSNPEVIKRITAEFFPVALKAALVNAPPDDEEGRLCAEIGRSKPAPQGICVANSAGKALDWALMFDDDKAVARFLDHEIQRFRQFPDGSKTVSTGRYMKFPSQRLPDEPDSGWIAPVNMGHGPGSFCRAKPPAESGTALVRVYGRALGADGVPMADTVRQEHYVEDRFEVPPEFQQFLANVCKSAGKSQFAIPEPIARFLVRHAYLGQLDLDPFGSPAGDRPSTERLELTAERVDGPSGIVRLRIAGKSNVTGGMEGFDPRQGGDGRRWSHAVSLKWAGFIDLKDDRIVGLTLLAEGSEKLKWGNVGLQMATGGGGDVSRLPAGHYIDLSCGVRYGMIGEPVGPNVR
jgi:hypothetical protein